MTQTRLGEKIESGNFKVGDKVRFKNRYPNHIMIIKRFVDADYVSLCLPDGEKGYSAFCYIDGLEKVDENGV